MQYIIQLRIQHALKLLRETDMTITQVAMESGFYDISDFCRKFKNKFGCSPKMFKHK
ncbi:MAG TPA: hypothetical protein DD727_07405 [Clostridiales bacterium]|nr:hypothetical protein [Clostridiales bacterium]